MNPVCRHVPPTDAVAHHHATRRVNVSFDRNKSWRIVAAHDEAVNGSVARFGIGDDNVFLRLGDAVERVAALAIRDCLCLG